MIRLGEYLASGDSSWEDAKRKATEHNPWFTPGYIDLSVRNIADNFLSDQQLTKLMERYNVPDERKAPNRIGIVMAGNIPLVGFHDMLCCFLSGHYAVMKLSSKDNVLLEHIVKKLVEFDSNAAPYFTISEMLKGCDAYITTGSNNSARYFEYYFGKYPHIIRKNRTSVAVLTGDETVEELEKLADDVHQYFGLGCRNVTRLYVPKGYDFIPLLEAFKKYSWHFEHNKYKNNYDYQLAILIMNNKYYMTNGSIILVEDPSLFSPISQVNYEYYINKDAVEDALKDDKNIQCVVGRGHIPFGEAQCPPVDAFADGVDTMAFLKEL
jgi:hypothetical protein